MIDFFDARSSDLLKVRSLIRRHYSDFGAHEKTRSTLFDYNDPRDIEFSHPQLEFKQVVHIFHSEWIGIRSACGALPGNKLAISADKKFDQLELSAIVDMLEAQRHNRFVFHGFSDNAALLVDTLVKRGCADKLYVVLHGSSAQWALDFDRKTVFDLLALAAEKKIRRFHIMKSGQETLLANQYTPILYNFSPSLSPLNELFSIGQLDDAMALVPGWGVLHKNIYNNMIGALRAQSISVVWAYAPVVEHSHFSTKRIIQKTFGQRRELLNDIRRSHICLNVSMLDCHPMINLEAQAVGRPCLRGPLFLDALEDHEYVRLTEVQNIHSWVSISEAVDRCLAVPGKEISNLIDDYTTIMSRIAEDRYADFLGL